MPGADNLTQAHADAVLDCIRRNLERYDFEIAEETGESLAVVRETGARLAASGAVMACSVTRFENGVPTNAWFYRISGYRPAPKPGRKPKSGG